MDTFTQDDCNRLIDAGVTLEHMEEISAWVAMVEAVGEAINISSIEHFPSDLESVLLKNGLIETCKLPDGADPKKFRGVRVSEYGMAAYEFGIQEEKLDGPE